MRRPGPSVAPKVMPAPRNVSIQITGACNLKCRYCFYSDEMARRDDLPTETWQEFFRELGQLACMEIILSGGEPFLRPDLPELIDGIVANRMRYTILTNGTLLTEQRLNMLNSGKRRLRLNSVQISLDGASAEVHDLSRPDSFDRSFRALMLLKEAGFPVSVRTTICRHNLLDLENIAKLLLDEIGLQAFSTNEAQPVGTGCRLPNKTSLAPKDQFTAMAIIQRLERRYPGRISSQSGPQTKLRMFRQMEHARQTGDLATDWAMGALSACGCVFSRIDILHDGTIVPCCMLPGVSLGRICRDSLVAIWNSHSILGDMRRRSGTRIDRLEGCRDCEWNRFCNGGCPGIAHQLTGSLLEANPADCYRTFREATGGVNALPD